jgi:hypothetical protein
MDLRQAYKATIEALDRKERELAEEKQRLVDRTVQLDSKEKELVTVSKTLEQERQAVSDIKSVKEQKELNEQRVRDLTARESAIKVKELELKKYENQLFEIKTRQDTTDKQLREREQEVVHREKTYREEVEKSFASNLAKNLLNK